MTKRKEYIIAEYQITQMFDLRRRIRTIRKSITAQEERLQEAQESIGPKSPKIKSSAEAKYQRGSRDVGEPAMQLIIRTQEISDRLEALRNTETDLTAELKRYEDRYSRAGFTPLEGDVLQARYGSGDAVETIADRLCYAPSYVYRIIREACRKYYRSLTAGEADETQGG